MSGSPTDSDLIERSFAEPSSFGALFDRHYDAVHSFAVRRAGRSDGEEVAAEVFLRAFDRRRRYDLSFTDARPWLLGIASNLLRRRWRTDRRRLAALARVPRESATTGPTTRSLAPDLVAALARLPVRDRETLLLHAWADLSYEEVARALEIPVGTVRSRLARSRAALRAALAPERPLDVPLAKEATNA